MQGKQVKYLIHTCVDICQYKQCAAAEVSVFCLQVHERVLHLLHLQDDSR